MSADGKPKRSADLTRGTREMRLAKLLGLPLDWDSGVTTPEQRRELIRTAILEQRLADTECYRATPRGSRSWRQAFQETFGTPLVTDELDFAFTATEVA